MIDKKYNDKTEKIKTFQTPKKTQNPDNLNNKGKYITNDSPIKDENEIPNIYIIFDISNMKLISKFLSFLEFKDIYKLKNINKHFRNLLSNKKILREYALSGVLFSENRLIFYKTFINRDELKNNLINQFSSYEIKDNLYSNVLSLAKENINKEEKFKSIHKQINKDINRTFYTDKFKFGNGKEMLENLQCNKSQFVYDYTSNLIDYYFN